jgi:hypothetical protein
MERSQKPDPGKAEMIDGFPDGDAALGEVGNDRRHARVYTTNSDSDVLVMQSAEERM